MKSRMSGKEEKVPPPLILCQELSPMLTAMTAPEATNDPNPGMGREPMRRQRKVQGQHLDDYLFAKHFDRLQELPEHTSYFEALNYTVRSAPTNHCLGRILGPG